MRRWYVAVVLVLLALLLVSCEGGYVTTGTSTRAGREGPGGFVIVTARSANGTTVKDLADDDESLDDVLAEGVLVEVEADLKVGAGSVKIEFLGEDDAVTATLEAREGESVTGRGQMVTDVFGDARYRVTAVEAKDVEYAIYYVIQ